MKKVILALAFLFGITVSAQSTWKVDKSHSNISFDITHLMISEVTGNFGDFEIEATADEAFKEPAFNVEIKTASIDTDNTRRDDHLRSEDFFAAEQYPSLLFKTTSVESTDGKNFKLKGDLTMRGVTKPVTLEGKLNGIITDQRSNKLKAGLKLTGTVNRLEYGVGGETPTLGDDVALTINLEMAQQ